MFGIRLVVPAIAAICVLSAARAATLTEDFTSNPAQRGWQAFGNTNLFRWNATNQDLAVTWDSSQTNSYYWRPLGTILTTNDEFSLEFDLQLTDAVTANYGSELAVGFLRVGDAASPAFLRSSGTSPNVAEFDYFPPSALDPSVDVTLIDRSNNFWFAYDNLLLQPGTGYHIALSHTAGQPTLEGRIFNNGQLVAACTNVFGAAPSDFRLDVVAVASYQDDGFGDTVLAHGTVDNFVIKLPPPPVQNFTGTVDAGTWSGSFLSQSGWSYTLERSTNFEAWTAVEGLLTGNASTVTVTDSPNALGSAVYRIRAERP